MAGESLCPVLTSQEHQELLNHAKAVDHGSMPWGLLTLITAASFGAAGYGVLQWRHSGSIAVGALLLGFALLLLQILMHECAHGTLTRHRRLNSLAGWLLGLWVLTPFFSFRRGHVAHHRHAGTVHDPTAAPRGSERGQRIVELLIRSRLVPVLYLGGVFWPYFTFDLRSEGRRSPKRLALYAFSLASIAGLHLVLAWQLGAARYALLLAGAFWVSAMLYEYLFTQNQHIGLLPDSPQEKDCHSRDQHSFSRSIRLKCDGLFLYFNLHKEHHICPQVPYRSLPRVHAWLQRHRPDILDFTSHELGILSRRRNLRVYAPMAGDHDS
jgi:omega-6 fatty acid desaturase (delta-12 desaturase)